VPWNSCWGAPFVTFANNCCFILESTWLASDLIKMWLQSGLKVFQQERAKACFLLRPFGRLSCNSIKTYWNSILNLIFWTLWPNWLNLFGHFKLNSVDDWKKPGRNQVRNYQMTPAESLKKRALQKTIFRSLLVSAPMLTVVGWNKWKQTTKREHSWFGIVAA